MKVLGIACSPRKKGNTEILMEIALTSAKDAGAEVELISIADKNIAPCDGCESCAKTKKCRIEDDMQEICSKLLEADGIILGTPVYFWNVTAQAKTLIDRTYVFREGRRLRNKVAGAIVIANRAGASHTFGILQNFFSTHRMISVAGAIGYTSQEISPEERGGGAIAYAGEKGEVNKDRRGIAEARALGKAIVKTIRRCSTE